MIRVALIDGDHHLESYASALPRLAAMSIIGVVGADKHRAGRARNQLGAEFTADTLDHLLAQSGQFIDAVLIHSPLHRRCELVCRAAKAGKHVWVASPMARTTQEADTMLETCKSAGVTMMVGQPMRFMPFQRTVHHNLTAGKLGAPGLLRIHHWRLNTDEMPEESPQNHEAVLVPRLIDEVDLSCWLFGDSPTTIYAVSPTTPGIGFRHDIQVHLGFRGGGMALIDCSINDRLGRDPYYSLTMIGSSGAVYADDHHNTNLWFHENSATCMRVGQGLEHVRLQLQEFTDALESHREPMSNGKEGRRAIAVVQAAITSLAARRVAHLVEERYELR